jgi:hypothetical protein
MQKFNFYFVFSSVVELGLNQFRLQDHLLIGLNIFQFRVCYLTTMFFLRLYSLGDEQISMGHWWNCTDGQKPKYAKIHQIQYQLDALYYILLVSSTCFSLTPYVILSVRFNLSISSHI